MVLEVWCMQERSVFGLSIWVIKFKKIITTITILWFAKDVKFWEEQFYINLFDLLKKGFLENKSRSIACIQMPSKMFAD